MAAPILRRARTACLGGLLAAGLLLLPRADPPAGGDPPPSPTSSPAAPSPPPQPPGRAVSAPRPDLRLRAIDETAAHAALFPLAPSEDLALRYPAQAAAARVAGLPASNYWALIVGIDDYAGSTPDTVGSVGDARALAEHLRSLGWLEDHILVMTDRDATASRILEGLRWLASKTDASSVVVFHYSGHERPLRTSSDGDAEPRDVALWGADNRLVPDGVLGRELGRISAGMMWVDIAACRAGGFDDPGTAGPGRVVTASSLERELSYEDPTVRHSVFGWYLIVEAMRQGNADASGDGEVSVEEAFRYAAPLVTEHAGGRQHPVLADGLAGDLVLRPPPPPPPPPEDPGRACRLGLFCRDGSPWGT
jgi:hypothetical protein